MYFVAFVNHKPGRVQADGELIAAFAKYLRDHPDHPEVAVHNAGPTFADDLETIVGSLLILEASSSDAARAFLADSPYGKADVFANAQIRPFEWRLGRPE